MTKFLIKLHQLTGITRMDIKNGELEDGKVTDQFVKGSKM